jgi:hypothetical protein
MNAFLTHKKAFSTLLSALMLVLGLQAGLVNAAMISTESQLRIAPQSDDQEVQKDRLQKSLETATASVEVRKWLASRGVSPEYIEQRIAAMTPEELRHFNAEMENMPAGSGVLGVIIVVFVILIVLDLLGTTNIFPVIKPINQY